MSLGKINKKTAVWLSLLGLLAAYSVYTNVLSGPDTPPSSATHTAADSASSPVTMATAVGSAAAPRVPASRGRADEFHPVYIPRRIEDRLPGEKIDPTLRGELLAKVQSVSLAGGARNLFAFSPPPPKEAPKLAGPEPKVAVVRPFVGPKEPPPPAPPKPPTPPPPPPPITLKFYGFATRSDSGKRTAYFLDDAGEILMASEGDTVKRRYKIVRIGTSSVTIDDLDAKHQSSVPIIDEGPAS
jgi:hypothetical protein